jgi:hypothetical protein
MRILGERRRQRTSNEKRSMRNTKHQTPSTKEAPNPKLQSRVRALLWIHEARKLLGLGNWVFLVPKSRRKFSQVSRDRPLDNPFPLTPALSLGEREPRHPALAMERGCRVAEDWKTILPLPWGEGRGEWKVRQRIWKRFRHVVSFKRNFQISLADVWCLEFLWCLVFGAWCF